METDSQRDDDQSQSKDDETVEEFKDDMEKDPSRAPSGDEDLERQRGG